MSLKTLKLTNGRPLLAPTGFPRLDLYAKDIFTENNHSTKCSHVTIFRDFLYAITMLFTRYLKGLIWKSMIEFN